MGYDNNTPLSGVTGGGLPAEIWRETMVRVHEGVPPKPLPMRAPDEAAASQADALSVPNAPRESDGFLENLLRDILGVRDR